VLIELTQQKQRARRVVHSNHRVERFDPVARFFGIAVSRVAASRRCRTSIRAAHACLPRQLM
jgi:hypothetical protein